MRFDYQPGEWMMSDFSGKTLPICTRDGEVMAEILVCLLPRSGLTFAVAVPDQTLASWTVAHRSAFEYIGGVAERMVCDNLRSAVTRWCEGEAEFNKTFADFARHYGIAVVPACPGEPRHKGPSRDASGSCKPGSWHGCVTKASSASPSSIRRCGPGATGSMTR